MIANANRPATNIIASIIGVVTLLLGASGVFGQLQSALNTIWGVTRKAGGGVLRWLRDRFLSFGMVAVIGFLLLVSLVISTALAAFGNWLSGLFPGVAVLLQVVNFLISFAVITVLFALIFKFLPDVEITWHNVWVGAAITSLLFSIGRFLIGLYLGQSTIASTYGAAGSLVVLLVWLYYSAQILFLGADFTYVYAQKRGVPVKAARGATTIKEGVFAEGGPKQEGQPSPSRADSTQSRRASPRENS